MSTYCQHDWKIENLRTDLPQGAIIHAIVVCLHCQTVKKPITFGDWVLQGSEAEKIRDRDTIR